MTCEPEFLRALIVGLVLGFACGFGACAALTISRQSDER